VRVTMKRHTGTGIHSVFFLPASTKGSHRAAKMHQRECTDERGRQVIRREWRNTDGQLHRTIGPAVENWTVLPGGARVLSYQGWFLNGRAHREGRPAWRSWYVAEDGTRVLVCEEWARHDRVGGPSYRRWTTGPDGTRTPRSEWYRVNGKSHRVDGPAYDRGEFWWHGVEVRQEDLPWLRRGRSLSLLVPLAAYTRQQFEPVSPAWSRDARVTSAGANTPMSVSYRSAVGGAVLLCV